MPCYMRPQQPEDIWVRRALFYAIGVMALGGYLTFTHVYSSEPVVAPPVGAILLWLSLYIPVIVLPLVTRAAGDAAWSVTEFGFTLSQRMALVSGGCVLLLILILRGRVIAWEGAGWEAFARTGEEVFFRGFLLALFTRLFARRQRALMWAVGVSALLFALVHTQTFRPEFQEWYGSAYMPLLYRIVERMLNLFVLGVGFALLFTWTRSVLPIAIIHSVLNARSIQILPFVLLIYGGITFWAHYRGEHVVSPA